MVRKLACVILLVGCLLAVGTIAVGGTTMPIAPSQYMNVHALSPQPEPPDIPFVGWLIELFRSMLRR